MTIPRALYHSKITVREPFLTTGSPYASYHWSDIDATSVPHRKGTEWAGRQADSEYIAIHVNKAIKGDFSQTCECDSLKKRKPISGLIASFSVRIRWRTYGPRIGIAYWGMRPR